jgi:hypothetical protein
MKAAQVDILRRNQDGSFRFASLDSAKSRLHGLAAPARALFSTSLVSNKWWQSWPKCETRTEVFR